MENQGSKCDSITTGTMAASEPLLNECTPHAQQRNLLKDYFDEKELKFRHVSAEQFADVWLRYDRDGNGFIEGDEMHLFFSELLDAIVPDDLKQRMLNEEIDQLIAELRESLDKNDDDRIDISELAQLLPTEEEFIFLFFREHFVQSSVDFMRVWKMFDKDKSGFIEADELKDFLKELFKHSPKGNLISEDKLIEYTDNILRIFDKNKDRKLQLSEMARLVPVKENFLKRPFFKSPGKITDDDIDRVFSYYDEDHNGYMQDEELAAFFKDLLDLTQEDYDDEDLRCIKDAILTDWDADKDGKIYIDELKMMLRVQRQMSKK
ncbi:calbindin 32 [Echinococcus multilocularis]|uniref:Calbindin 32 n=1 Tax=Echinococcus multilocularis TaxID=6211 RepID=A0A068YNK6_ECHMU|nr:calbindin 32 [Echinococcus multilocularis]